jgi:hypothetical protein
VCKVTMQHAGLADTKRSSMYVLQKGTITLENNTKV